MDKFNREWIIAESVPIVESYSGLTLRGLHYQLVGLGMVNDIFHYKRVVSAMIKARWDGLVSFDAFLDHERGVIGETAYQQTSVKEETDSAKSQIKMWATSYHKNRWENQLVYAEVFIEKKALQGVFEPVCSEYDLALNPCKGYPSLTFLNDAKNRFDNATCGGKEPIILYFGDYDCSGEDIPRSIGDNLDKMGVSVEVRRIALMEEQVIEWALPPAPTKRGDSRSKNWTGIGQVELDAVKPEKIERLCREAIEDILDEDLYADLIKQESEERKEFKRILKRDFKKLI